MLPSGDVPDYDREQMRIMRIRRLRGQPYRDFESPVFTVPKSDGGLQQVIRWTGLIVNLHSYIFCGRKVLGLNKTLLKLRHVIQKVCRPFTSWIL